MLFHSAEVMNIQPRSSYGIWIVLFLLLATPFTGISSSLFDEVEAPTDFEEFETPLKKWLSWLSDEGLLFLFGRFNSRNVDTKIQFKNNTRNDPKWEGGLSAFSIHTITNFLKELGFKCEFKRFHLPIEIKEDVSNPIRTFTKELKTGEKIVMDGANIIAEHYFVVIGRDLES